jgi:hypothetical protein
MLNYLSILLKVEMTIVYGFWFHTLKQQMNINHCTKLNIQSKLLESL